MMARPCARGTSSTTPLALMPALLTRRSIGKPRVLSMLAMAAIEPSSVTSKCRGSIRRASSPSIGTWAERLAARTFRPRRARDCRVGGDVAAPTPHRPGRADLPSRPGEFHPEPLTDPDMNLSIHPARAIHRRLPPSVEIGGLLRSPVGPSLQRGWPPPFAPWALPHFSTTTEESAPAWPVGISASRISRLCLFPWHRQTGAPHPSAGGTSTLLIWALPSAPYDPVRLPRRPTPDSAVEAATLV